MFHTHDIPSLFLGVTRRITVWLPPHAPARRASLYPVLYLNDGQNLFDPARAFAGNTWRVAETAGRLIDRRRIPPLIVVGIDHGVAHRGGSISRSRTIGTPRRASRSGSSTPSS